MKYAVTRFRSPKLALKELEPFIRSSQHLAVGRPFKKFGDMRSREILANWLICAVINSTEKVERVSFSSDPIGGDGVLMTVFPECRSRQSTSSFPKTTLPLGTLKI